MTDYRRMIEATRQAPEYQKGLEILGDPDDYAIQTMLDFVGFFYVMTVRHEGSIEGLDAFVRQMGIVPEKTPSGYTFSSENEEALTAVFTFLIGRTSKAYFDEFLKHRKELVADRD